MDYNVLKYSVLLFLKKGGYLFQIQIGNENQLQ